MNLLQSLAFSDALHTLLHRSLVQLSIVVNLADVLRLGLAFEVKERCVVIGETFVILHIPKHVEEVLIVILGVFDLLRQIIGKVAIDTTLAWLICLILLGAESHHVSNSFLEDCALNALKAKDELEQILKLFLWVRKDVLKSEEVDWLLATLSDIDPVLEPSLVPMSAITLEVPPVREHGLLSEFVLERGTVALSQAQVEERRVGIELVACAHHSDIGTPILLERKHVWEMCLVDPSPVIHDALSFEAAVLQGDIRRVLDDHIRASCRASDILEVLAHQTVATARVGSVNYLDLFRTVA